MKTFTIRGLDDQLDTKLKATAKEKSMSVNQWIIKILRQAMGLDKEQKHTRKYQDLDFLFGVWSKEDFREFQKSQKDFQRVDPEMWK